MHRIVIFTNLTSCVPSVLLERTIRAVQSREDMTIVAVCVPTSPAYGAMLFRHVQQLGFHRIQSFFDRDIRYKHTLPRPLRIRKWAKRYNFKVLVPDENDVNHPAFLERLRNDVAPTVALSYYCLQIFGPGLLDLFEHPVNYHNSLLPAYGGRKATAWSVYKGETRTGFTFHRITPAVDQGPILLQGSVPAAPGDLVFDLEYEKARAAGARIPELLDKIADGDTGRAQPDARTYFSWKDYSAIRSIAAPSAISLSELKQRLRAFGCVRIQIGGQWYWISRVEDISDVADRPERRGRLCFRSADGRTVKPTRFAYLPWVGYRALQRIGAVAKKLRHYTESS